MKQADIIKKLRFLTRTWARRAVEYQDATLEVGEGWTAARYEGISTGSRWAAEDLQKFLDLIDTKK